MPHKSHPLSELSSILAFEDVESAMEFLEYHGLIMNEDRTQVILDRQLFNVPVIPYALDRATNVIESKRNFSVGQIVCGGVLPTKDYENHVPQNSFDSEGFINLPQILKELNLKLPDVSSSSIEEETETEQEENIDENQEQNQSETENIIQTPPKPKPFESGNLFGAKLFSNIQEKERSRSPIIDNKPVVQNKGLWGSKASTSDIFGKTIFASQNASIFGNVPKISTNLEVKDAQKPFLPATLPSTSTGSIFQQKTVANLPDIVKLPTIAQVPPQVTPQDKFVFKLPEVKKLDKQEEKRFPRMFLQNNQVLMKNWLAKKQNLLKREE